MPHGYGEKIFKNGKKMIGCFKEGELFGWGLIMEKGEIFIGPFYDGKGVTGKGEKFALRKRAVYINRVCWIIDSYFCILIKHF